MNPIVKTNNLVIHLPKEGAVSGSLGNPRLYIYIYIYQCINKERVESIGVILFDDFVVRVRHL